MTAASLAPPATLSHVLGELLESASRKELRERARRISEGFRAGADSKETIRDETDALAYALTRLPATYAAAAAVLRRLREEIPDFAPQSLLDAGCGLGSGAAAALETWPNIASVALVDRSPPFLALARQLAGASAQAAMANGTFVDADLTALPADLAKADLVLASYALTEIADDAMSGVLDGLWARCREALVVVEPGTPRGWSRLMRLRGLLIAAGATIALPCPHEASCPLAAPDWCHFAARLPRSRDHKALKSAEAPFEDEKFSYLVALKGTTPARGARLIAPPRQFKWGARLRLCARDGLGETNTLRRDKANFKSLRSCVWGDSIRIEEP